MTNVVAFKPRPRPPEPAPLPAIDLRTHLEDAAQTALDAAEKIMAALDQIDSGEGTDLRPIAMPNHAGQAGEGGESWDQYRAGAREAEAVPVSVVEQVQETAALAQPELPDTELEEVDALDPCPEPIRLPWHGAGNVVSAAGCAVLFLVGMRA